jgi:transposase
MTNTTQPHLGLDVAKATFDAALLQDGRTHHRQFPNSAAGFTALHRWLEALATMPIHACAEATGSYGEALALFLHQQGVRVSVVNPARIKAFANSELLRTKTDRVDAALIARFGAAHQPRPWTPPPLAQRQLQALVRRLESLKAMRQQERNRLDLEPADSLLDTSLTQHLAHLDRQIATLQQQVRTHVQSHPTLCHQAQLLQSIPAIGETTAHKLLAEVPLLGQYRSARQAAAYAGLSPRQRQSGSSVHGKTRLSKVGNAAVRRALYLPAVVALRANPLLRVFAQRLLAAGKPKMAVVGAVMRKLLHQAHGVLKHNRPFDPNHIPTT